MLKNSGRDHCNHTARAEARGTLQTYFTGGTQAGYLNQVGGALPTLRQQRRRRQNHRPGGESARTTTGLAFITILLRQAFPFRLAFMGYKEWLMASSGGQAATATGPLWVGHSLHTSMPRTPAVLPVSSAPHHFSGINSSRLVAFRPFGFLFSSLSWTGVRALFPYSQNFTVMGWVPATRTPVSSSLPSLSSIAHRIPLAPFFYYNLVRASLTRHTRRGAGTQ